MNMLPNINIFHSPDMIPELSDTIIRGSELYNTYKRPVNGFPNFMQDKRVNLLVNSGIDARMRKCL